jgi:hypothetical protein
MHEIVPLPSQYGENLKERMSNFKVTLNLKDSLIDTSVCLVRNCTKITNFTLNFELVTHNSEAYSTAT